MNNFETFKSKYEKGFITIPTLRGYVKINAMNSMFGITADEFEEITGQPYESATN